MTPPISQLVASLPKQQHITVSHEPDYYGAAWVAATMCGRSSPTPYAPKSWLHGWIYKPLEYVREILFWGDENDIHLVHTTEQEEFLRCRGYRYTYAVGAPFLYVPPSGAPRLPNSILVMPPHCTKTTLQTFDESAYLDALSGILQDFEHVLFCIHPEDAESGSWTHNLSCNGYPFVVGAGVDDKAALYKMRHLFDSFDVVTSPNLGSHIPYAGYCGCRVSVFGPKLALELESYRKDPWSAANWEVVEKGVAWQKSDKGKELYALTFNPPGRSIRVKKWAEEILGESNRKNSHQLSTYFGWSFWGRVRDLTTKKQYAQAIWPIKQPNR